jgi:hypothetical protein
MRNKKWVRLLAYVTGSVNQELLLQNEVACVAKPDTILASYRRLVAAKFDGSKHRQYLGRPRVPAEVEALVVRMARENTGWGI